MVFELLAAAAALGVGALAARRVGYAYRQTQAEMQEEQRLASYYNNYGSGYPSYYHHSGGSHHYPSSGRSYGYYR